MPYPISELDNVSEQDESKVVLHEFVVIVWMRDEFSDLFPDEAGLLVVGEAVLAQEDLNTVKKEKVDNLISFYVVVALFPRCIFCLGRNIITVYLF